ncbi:MAG: Long-chain-fatty-acid--CoA ligase [Promethearchaeota archaeon CR_4]|nr:MAG: Long-chain-fatty-acid--CoA ligase [Candidatus Lokiarchaeota archaeon CR_4]
MVFVPIDQFLKGDSLKYVLNHCDCEYLILDAEFLDSFKEIRAALSRIKKVLLRNPPTTFIFDEFYVNFTGIISNNTDNPQIPIEPNDVMEILYTEGTTGKPKGVIYRNLKVIAGLIISAGLGSGRYGQVKLIYCPTPLYQSFAQLDIIFPTMFLNTSIAITEKFDATIFWDDVRRYKTDLIIYYGGILQTLFNQPPRDNDRDQPARWAIGGEAPRHIWENFENRFGITLIEGWGATEAPGPIINRLGSRDGKMGSIGIPLDGYEVKIVDEDGNALPPGPQHIGEMAIKTFTPNVLEYYKEPESTPMIRGKDGFVYTGDMVYRDKDGYLYYTGRKADIIKRLGGSIPAHMIENVANAHPFILESVVFGVPGNKSSGDDLKICVVLKNTRMASTLTPAQFYEYLQENLANFMVPRYIEFQPMLRTSSERIKKYLLR